MNDDLERIRKKVQRGFEVVEVHQAKPHTIVKIRYASGNGGLIIGWGVATQCLWDEWNAERGMVVAGAKAMDDVVDKIMDGKEARPVEEEREDASLPKKQFPNKPTIFNERDYQKWNQREIEEL